jgi:hypothetical protein
MKKREAPQRRPTAGVRVAMTGLAAVFLLAATPLKLPLPLSDARGVAHTEREVREGPLTVFVFLATDCPICNR